MAPKQDTTSLSLPNDVESCHDMIKGLLQTLAQRESRVEELETIVDQLIHRLRDDQKSCPGCGAQLVIVLVQGAEQWSYKPAEIFGLVHLHEKGYCNCCHGHVVQAEKPPQIIEKGAADASLLAHVTTSKHGDHLPLYTCNRTFVMLFSRSSTLLFFNAKEGCHEPHKP